ncbi:PepSY-associated TM helix domain-containing protein [Sphingomonas immobilis]|uniref:PepSY-associated TM helix domain-containing protein n=1 Tax=Sphingomonas immobilis TaxID=3063997 RepID=A0ABT8ZTE6_9SPHN|nr:PepSY-associated TM helix domain-containing protein [Sphingomonas sp. CA1-15]MDO7840838.1 PepSY-associated TM helix domain-containing protein [Sphingomonas sp. CA1-15]
MSKSFRQSQATLHTWSGLLVGWVLFIVFVSGTTAYWREALNRWAQPELPRVEDPARVVRGSQAFLAKKAPDAKTWFITAPSDRSAAGSVFWVPAKGGGRGHGRRDTSATIDAEGQPVTARATRGGDFFYRFHFDLFYMPVIWARWIVSICAMFMLVAILSGIVTHKKIFRDFFTFRGGKGQRSWLDGHNAVAVLGLPFHLMITYTGLVTLMAMLMPWAVVANYAKPGAFFDLTFPQAPPAERADRPAPLVDIASLWRDGARRLGTPVDFIAVTNPGDAAARVTMSASNRAMLSSYTPSITYDGVTGKVIWASPPSGGAQVTAGAMIGLHAGRFGDYPMRWLYFLCGIGGSLMVASGLVLWTVKRREKLPDPERPHFGFHLVERLNVGVVGGYPLAIAGFLWANRLLPVGLADRANAEVNTMFALWGAVLLFAFVRKPVRAWAELLGLTGALLVALPVFDMIATPKGLPATIAAGDWVLAAADLTLLALGLCFGWAANRVRRHRPYVRRARDAERVAMTV